MKHDNIAEGNFPMESKLLEGRLAYLGNTGTVRIDRQARTVTSFYKCFDRGKEIGAYDHVTSFNELELFTDSNWLECFLEFAGRSAWDNTDIGPWSRVGAP
ncbi:MAG: hypothetical protein JNK63_07915 [Chthonomonas sp.]|nr:hypothetical protein [Chthonomonas sp.]